MTIQKKNKLIAATLLIVSLLFFAAILLLPNLPASPQLIWASMILYGIFLMVGISKINAVVLPSRRRLNLNGPQAKAIIQSAEKLDGKNFAGWVLNVTVLCQDRPEFNTQVLTTNEEHLYQEGDEVMVVYDAVDPTNIMLVDDQLPPAI